VTQSRRSNVLSRSLLLVALAGAAFGGVGTVGVRVAHAEPSAAAVKEAGKHFQRGVALYTEADYHAALVEFRRAYEIAPNAAVLYNIGEAYFQLQNYAAALITLQRYLNESGQAAAHRREVEQTLDTLQTRVGKVAVTTSVPDCDVLVDDEPAGRTPLAEPVLVSIGRRKITVVHEGRAPEVRYVSVAAGDTVPLSVAIGEPSSNAKPLANPASPSNEPKSDGKGWITAGWVATGVLGATALGTGVAAYIESRKLQDLRDTFGTSHSELDSKSNTVSRLALISDITLVGAVAVGGVTFFVARSRNNTETRVALTPNGIQVAGTFR
jgi:hypothetical protein